MAFDKNAWDPTPAQLAGFAVPVSWLAAYLLESFILGESDVATCLGSIVSGLTGGGRLETGLSRILTFFVAPYFALWGLMMLGAKNLTVKRVLLGVGVLGLGGYLVLGDLSLSLF